MPQRVLIASTSALLAGRLAARCLASADGAEVVLLCAAGSRPGAIAPEREELAAFVARSARASAPPGAADGGDRLTVVCAEPDAVAVELKAWTADQVWCLVPGWDRAPVRGARVEAALTGTVLAALPGLGARGYVHVGPDPAADGEPDGPVRRTYRDLERLAVEACLDGGVGWRVLRTPPVVDASAPVLGECPPGAHRLLWALHSVRCEVEDREPDWFERHPLRVADAEGRGLVLLPAERAAGELWRAGAPGELPDGFATVASPAPVALSDVLARAGAVHGIDVRAVPDREGFSAADRLLDLRLENVRRHAVPLVDPAASAPGRVPATHSAESRAATPTASTGAIPPAPATATPARPASAPARSASAAPAPAITVITPEPDVAPPTQPARPTPDAEAPPPDRATPPPIGGASPPDGVASPSPTPHPALSAAAQWDLFGSVRAYQAVAGRTTGTSDRREAALRRRSVEVAGRPLVLYEAGAGDGPPLVVLNALGQGPGFLSRLCARLAPHHRVVTWQVRGTERDEPPWRTEDQLDDVEAVLDAAGAGRAHLIGWCTGAKIATAFQRRRPDAVASLVFLNATFRQNGRWDGMDTKYEADLAAVCRALDRGPHKAARMLGLLAPGAAGGKGNPGSLDAGVLGVLSRALTDEVRRPFRDAEVLVRYARQLVDLWRLDSAAQAPRVTVPALFVCSEFDGISSPARAREAARCFPHARYAELAVAGHYAPHDRPALVAELITEFVRAPDEVADLLRYAELTWHIDTEGTAR
ncbi:alpha/beta fold hydrolase [Streptomyces sp. NPDC040750]|uniref:alpha/beta fold hydrolase n=1 Tax=Streptomyces sp. NPDC040750 TaxID=3154491 RepID=UPI0033F9C923